MKEEEGNIKIVDATQVTSASSDRAGLLPALGLRDASHLPTPQSPTNPAVYAHDVGGAYDSPVRNGGRDNKLSAQRAITPPRDETQVAPATFMTPESSPVFLRKAMAPLTPVAGPSSIPHTPVRNVSEAADASADHSSTAMDVDTAVLPLAPAPIISTPVSAHSRGLTPASRLSSPFQDRLSSVDHRTAQSQSRSPVPVDSPMGDVFSITPLPSSPPPLATPIPQRALGGEIQRIHLQLAADRAERLAESEARRPDYLVREKRPRSDADIPTLDELDAADATLGVAESPVKGRRLQLFQATSEETFEQSLLAGGYPGYGQSPAYQTAEPQTPLPNTKNRGALSQRALHWLQHATPGQPGPSTATTTEPAPPDEPEPVQSEKEIRKRRRLDAFRDRNDKSEEPPAKKLYPQEVEGMGRVLVDAPPSGSGGTGAAPAHDAPTKRRIPRRKRRRGGARRGQGAERGDEEEEVLHPNWPDAAFPWCLRAQERVQREKMEEEERLKWIARFLERDSESDAGEGDDDQGLRPPLRAHDNDQVALRRGRGKMLPLRAAAGGRRAAAGAENAVRDRDKDGVVPSDPADARAALLSKRSMRQQRRRRVGGRGGSGAEDDVEEVRCVGCLRGDDGTSLVQCDECTTWYHLACVGIEDVEELGREEDLWYCDRCLEITPSSPLEPTFVPTATPATRAAGAARDGLFLQHPSSFLESPAGVVNTPQTPIRSTHGGRDGRGGGLTRTFSTRSSYDDERPSSRAGPSTPQSSARTVRVYHTPGPFAFAHDGLGGGGGDGLTLGLGDGLDLGLGMEMGFDPETPFDPTTTPSRGLKFSGGPPPTLGLSTPTPGAGVALWVARGGQTPTPAARLGAFGAGMGGGMGLGGGGAGARSIYSAAYEDTPVTHASAPRLQGRLAGGGRKLWDVEMDTDV